MLPQETPDLLSKRSMFLGAFRNEPTCLTILGVPFLESEDSGSSLAVDFRAWRSLRSPNWRTGDLACIEILD